MGRFCSNIKLRGAGLLCALVLGFYGVGFQQSAIDTEPFLGICPADVRILADADPWQEALDAGFNLDANFPGPEEGIGLDDTSEFSDGGFEQSDIGSLLP